MIHHLSDTKKEHILIGGTGRSGTTLLVKLFARVGLETGFSQQALDQEIDSIANAGLERPLREANLPHVVKSPLLSDDIDDALQEGLRVEIAIIPIRRLFEAAESRRRVYYEAVYRGLKARKQPGGLWAVARPDDQEGALATKLHLFLEPLVRNDVPIVFLSFPRFTEDAEYFYTSLKIIFDRHRIAKKDVLNAHRDIVDLSLVHHFIADMPLKPSIPKVIAGQVIRYTKARLVIRKLRSALGKLESVFGKAS